MTEKLEWLACALLFPLLFGFHIVVFMFHRDDLRSVCVFLHIHLFQVVAILHIYHYALDI